MSEIDTKIEQCKIDIQALQENLKALQKQKKLEALPPIEGIELIKNRTALVQLLKDYDSKWFDLDDMKIFKRKADIILAIPLPNCNTTWTYEAWDLVRTIVALKDYEFKYPVHYKELDNSNYCHVRLG